MFLLKCRGGHKFVGIGDWRDDLKDIVGMANQGGAGIDYDEAYKYLEELTEGIDFSKLKEKPLIPDDKLSQSPADEAEQLAKIALAEKIAQEGVSSSEETK